MLNLLRIIDQLTLRSDLINCLLSPATKRLADFKPVFKAHGLPVKDRTLADVAFYIALPEITPEVVGKIMVFRRKGGVA